MDPNVIATIVGVCAIIISAWKIGGEIKAINARLDGMRSEFNARMDGVEVRLGNLEREVHSINEHFRRSPQ